MREKTAGFIIRFRSVALLLFFSMTIYLGYHASKMELIDNPNEWPPPGNPNVMLNQEIETNYGGANVVTIQVEVKNGDIFNYSTLKKIKCITDDILMMDGVVPFYLTSLAASKVKYMKGTEDSLDIDFLIPDYPRTQEDIDRIKYGVFHNPTIYGGLVSLDNKASLILADFWTSEKSYTHTTHPVIYKKIKEICEKYCDLNTEISYAGVPIIVGWVYSNLPLILKAFIFFSLIMLGVLWFSFRRIYLAVMTVSMGICVGVWAFGLYALLIDRVIKSSSAFIAPFILVAVAACHGVQILKRFQDEELPRSGNTPKALTSTFSALTYPVTVSLITDAMAFVICAIIPFTNVSAMGRVALLGFLSFPVCLLLFFLPMLTFLKEKKIKHHKTTIKEDRLEKMFGVIEEFLLRGGVRNFVVILLIGISVVSLLSFRSIEIGQDNTYAIHNYLTKSWNNSKIYQMQMEIKERFGTVFPLNILIKTRDEGGMKSPEILKRIDEFGEFLQKQKSIGGVMSLPVYIKLMNRTMNSEKEEYFTIPEERRAVADYLYLYDQGAPGSFQSVVDYRKYDRGVLVAFADSTSHKTVNSLLNTARVYAQNKFNNDQVTAFIGAGAIGIAGAFNDSVKKWVIWTIVLSVVASFVVVTLLMRSVMAGIFLLMPLSLATIIWFAVMYLTGIEINSNASLSLALGMGVGIDSQIYLVYRFREEFKRQKDFRKTFILSYTLIAKAITYSNLALIIGCFMIIPIPLYVGYIGYGMGMILLLCFLLSLVLPPILFNIFKPKFLFQ